MDQTILSGLFALGGAIIGGLVTIGATVISNRKQVDIELKKQRIDFLNTKRIKFEEILNHISAPIEGSGVREKGQSVLCFLQNNSHLFMNKKRNYGKSFKKLDAEINDLWCLQEFGIPEMDDDKIDEQINKINEVIAKFRSLILEELKDVVSILEKEINVALIF